MPQRLPGDTPDERRFGDPVRHLTHTDKPLADVGGSATYAVRVVGSNRMTIGVMRAIRDCGLTVPDDIALVVFDDFEWGDLFHPRLTAIAQSTAEMGEQAVEMVLTRLADP